MNSRLHRSIAASLVRALPLCLGLIIAGISPASSDQAATLTDAIARSYNSTQMSALIAAAAGRVEIGVGLHSQSLEPLQHALGVSNDVAAALLRVLDRTSVPPDRLAKYLADSTIQYHAVLAGLAEMNVDTPAEAQMVKRAQAALLAGRFSEAEAELRQIEDREVAASGRARGPSAALEATTDEHRRVAAQARTSLGTIAMIKLEYSEAAEHFLLARQLALSEELGVIQPQPITATGLADAAEPPQDQVVATDVAGPIDRHEAPDPRPPDAAPPAIAAVAPERAIIAVVQPTAMKPAPPDWQKSASAPITEAVVKPPPTVAALSTDMLQLLLRRGDSMLALGDLASARLLYKRAASAGDPAAAAVWYRKALDLGDASAAVRLKLLSPASGG